jgi:hypothetical protein
VSLPDVGNLIQPPDAEAVTTISTRRLAVLTGALREVSDVAKGWLDDATQAELDAEGSILAARGHRRYAAVLRDHAREVRQAIKGAVRVEQRSAGAWRPSAPALSPAQRAFLAPVTAVIEACPYLPEDPSERREVIKTFWQAVQAAITVVKAEAYRRGRTEAVDLLHRGGHDEAAAYLQQCGEAGA